MESTPDDLRRKAQEIRNSAQYAERSQDMKGELLMASRMEAEANRLESSHAPGLSKPMTPDEIADAKQKSEIARKARIAKAIEQLEQRFGGNR